MVDSTTTAPSSPTLHSLLRQPWASAHACPENTGSRPAGGFPDTRWSLVLAAADVAQPEALALFCETYWHPVREFFQRLGANSDRANEYAQAFFLQRVLEKRDLARLRPGAGSFSAWLKQALRCFLYNDQKARKRLKRWGGLQRQSYDPEHDASVVPLGSQPQGTDALLDAVWDQCWAREVVERALGRLASSGAPEWRERLLAELVRDLTGEASESAKQPIVAHTDDEPLAARRHQLRRKFRRCLRQEVQATLPNGACVDSELRRLHDALLTRQRPLVTLAILASGLNEASAAATGGAR